MSNLLMLAALASRRPGARSPSRSATAKAAAESWSPRPSNEHLAPIRERRAELAADPQLSRDGVRVDNAKANEVAGVPSVRFASHADGPKYSGSFGGEGNMSDSPVLPAEVSQTLRTIVDEAGITQNTGLVERLLATGIDSGHRPGGKLDLEIASAALTEMRAAFALFTVRADPQGDGLRIGSYQAHRCGLSADGSGSPRSWPGAAGWSSPDAGRASCRQLPRVPGPTCPLGVSIRLPFEEKPNSSIANRNVAMKYFSPRKLMLVKESSGFVYVPGGFGTWTSCSNC